MVCLEYGAIPPIPPNNKSLLLIKNPLSFSDKSQNLVSSEICWTPIFHGSNQLPVTHPESFALQMWVVGVAVLLYLALAEFHLAKGWWNTVGPCQLDRIFAGQGFKMVTGAESHPNRRAMASRKRKRVGLKKDHLHVPNQLETNIFKPCLGNSPYYRDPLNDLVPDPSTNC